jgi:hypothetical protein
MQYRFGRARWPEVAGWLYCEGEEHVGCALQKPLEKRGIVSGKSQVGGTHLRLAASAGACVIIKADYIIRRPAPIHDVWTMYNTGISTLLHSGNHHSKHGGLRCVAISLGKRTSQPKHYAVTRTQPFGQ